MRSKECLYLDTSDIPADLYESLYDLASFRGEFCESFFVRLDYIDNWVEDMKEDTENDYSSQLTFYEELSKKLWNAGYDLLFVCNDDKLRVYESSYDYDQMEYEKGKYNKYEKDPDNQCKVVSRGDKNFEIIEE